MSVHEAITAHSRKQHKHLEVFKQLDWLRETAIEEAVTKCLKGEPFDVNPINEATARINEHAKFGISPVRTFVTPDMIQQYADTLKR